MYIYIYGVKVVQVDKINPDRYQSNQMRLRLVLVMLQCVLGTQQETGAATSNRQEL